MRGFCRYWIWRMGISQAKKSELNSSEFYFDMHKEVAAISKHEMAHYFSVLERCL